MYTSTTLVAESKDVLAKFRVPREKSKSSIESFDNVVFLHLFLLRFVLGPIFIRKKYQKFKLNKKLFLYVLRRF